MVLTRVYKFSASHRLHAPSLDDATNHELYGKCNNPYGHGHNYALHVRVAGEPDPLTGRLVNVGLLDRFVKQRVIDVFDHRDMNTDVPGFDSVPTTENLALEVAKRLREGWHQTIEGALLEGIFVQETPRNTFELRMR